MDLEFADGPPHAAGEPCYRARFRSDSAEKNRVISEVLALLRVEADGGAREVFRVQLCLDEAIQNAISHGNRGDPRKEVEVAVFESAEAWEVQVRDQGIGFRPESVPDPLQPGREDAEGGRGLFILLQYMDRVRYFDGGRTLVMTRSRRRED